MSKQAIRYRRDKAKEDVEKPSAKEKFMKGVADIEAMQQCAVPKFVPATQNQKLAVSMLRSGCRLLFLQGSAGTGKSMLAAWWAATQKKEKKVNTITWN